MPLLTAFYFLSVQLRPLSINPLLTLQDERDGFLTKQKSLLLRVTAERWLTKAAALIYELSVENVCGDMANQKHTFSPLWEHAPIA